MIEITCTSLRFCECSVENKKALGVDVLLLNYEAQKMLLHGNYKTKMGSYKIIRKQVLLVLVELKNKGEIVDLFFP